jgi:hypothetical protein
MTKRPVQVADNQSQFKEFLETARALGCDEDKETFEAALAKIAAHKPEREPKKPKAGKRKTRQS